MAIIDLLSILPSINMINKGFKVLKTIRLIRTFRVLGIFKSFRYSKNIQIILQVGKNSKKALIAVLYLAIGYIFVCALIIFNNGFFLYGNCDCRFTSWYYYGRLYERNRIR